MDDKSRTGGGGGNPFRGVEGAFVVCAALLLLAPMSSKLLRFPRDAKVSGSETRRRIPAWTWASWAEGKYQQGVDEYLAQRSGLRNFFVKLYNQTQYSVFGELPRGGTRIRKGRDGWLYEEEYVSHYMRAPVVTRDGFELLGRRLAAVQGGLADRGIPFVVLVSPSKPEIYPEHLPAGVRRFDAEASRTNAYSLFVDSLRAHGVRHYDAHAQFLVWKQTEPLLYAPGGTHWNYYGAQRVANDLLLGLHSNGVARVPVLASVTNHVMLAPLGTDTDLRSLLNLWHFAKDEDVRVAYPVVARADTGASPGRKMKVVIVGDSFSFTLVDALARTGAVGEMELLYYFKRRFHYDLRSSGIPSGYTMNHGAFEVGSFTKDTLDWDGVFNGADLVILEVNEIMPGDEGWDFPRIANSWLQHSR